ncbi:MAG: hypothetical protein AAFW73_05155 [Bacteroidota bacterium]
MTKDETILQLRPEIPQIDLQRSQHPHEHFQNATLRPLLKQHNDLLMRLFIHHLDKQRSAFVRASALQQEEKIGQILQRNQGFRQLLIGTLIAWFTEEEWGVYSLQGSALNRRIISMATRRLQSQRVELLRRLRELSPAKS